MDTDEHGFGLSVFIRVHPWLEQFLPRRSGSKQRRQQLVEFVA
jgi:hypothetical protein